MTGNQIRFNEYRETKRHNKVSEIHEHKRIGVEQQKADASTLSAATGLAAQRETARHNVEMERQNWWTTNATVAETARHNKEQEKVQWFGAATAAHQAQTARMQAETARTKVGLDYEVGSRNAASAERQAGAAERNAQTNRINAATASRQVDLGYSQLAETKRHNMNQEIIGAQSVAATRSYNTAMADVAARNATTNERNADTQRYSARSGRVQDLVSMSQAKSAARQASTAQHRADTERIKAYTGIASTAISGLSQLGNYLNTRTANRINAFNAAGNFMRNAAQYKYYTANGIMGG